VTDRLGAIAALDPPARAVAKRIRGALRPGALKDGLSGTWLGHPLHPLLTDVPIGTWTSATLLDLVGGREGRKGADRLIAVGIAAAIPTALTGASDWADSEFADDHVRRIGAAHAVANSAALVLYGASLACRARGRRGRGVVLGLAGAAAMGAGGFLGGDLSYARGVGVDQTAFADAPGDWTPVLDASMLVERRPVHALAGDLHLVLVPDDGTLHCLVDRCAHRGGALHEGRLVDGCIECPLHGSRFALDDGSVRRGPSAYSQPRLEARVRDGRVEVRAPAR
jgi:nitrite reductase/ring-hydroxylating ferredoxin subunit/uncharacterized membrane protein